MSPNVKGVTCFSGSSQSHGCIPSLWSDTVDVSFPRKLPMIGEDFLSSVKVL
jgi:hypothetical protein